MPRIDDLASQTIGVGTLRASLMSKVTMICGVDGSGNPASLVITGGAIPVTPSAPAATAVKTLISSTNATGTIPTGFISGVLVVGAGATVTIDGIPLVAGQSITYYPGPKLHPVVNWASLTGGTLYGWYEV